MSLISSGSAPGDNTPTGSRGRVKGRILSMLATFAVALTAVVGGVTIAPEPANAAGTTGAGGYWTPAGGWLGNYIAANGTRVYCIDVLVDSIGSGGDAGVESSAISGVSGTRAVSGAELQMMNYAISVHGQTSDPIIAAAVSAYVYNFTSANWYGNGAHYIDGPNAGAIQAAYNAIAADTAANYANGGGSGSVSMDFVVDPTNNYLGTLNIHNMSPSNATGTITLTNGVFIDTGLATRDGVTNNSSFPVRGVPPEDSVEYKISVEGAFTAAGGYGSSVRIHSDAPQRTAGPGGRSVSNFTGNGIDPSARSRVFQPVVGTKVESKFVERGETFSDILTFSTAPDTNGLNNPWFTRGGGTEYAQITARGSLYFTGVTPPVESDEAPANAMLVASDIMVTTTKEDGPTIDYTVPSDYVSDEAGYYTWVWEILQSDQQTSAPNVQAILPADYHYKDRFGRIAETSITATTLTITTAVTDGVVPILGEATDGVTVTPVQGGWIQADGQRVPATLTGTAYYSATEPVLADEAPADAEIVGTTTLVVNKSGTTVSNPVKMPIKEGFVTFQWCLNQADQPAEYQGMIAETCDKYGQASETVKVVAPDVTTQARELATIYDGLYDTGIVNGFVPDNVTIVSSLYKKPEVGDFKMENGQPTEEVWTQEEIDAIGEDAVCEVSNYIGTTEPVEVKPGQNDNEKYRMPDIFVDEEGTYWWIEETIHTDPETGEQTVIRAGKCGLPNETTIVDKPKVTTKAIGEGHPSDVVTDTAIVEGPLSDREDITYDLTWQAYHRATGTTTQPDEKLCTAETLVWESKTPVSVTAPGEYKSEGLKLEDKHVGEILWVETLNITVDGEREVVHRGECGAATEITKVTPRPTIVDSGVSPVAASVAAGAFLLIAGAASALIIRNRRNKVNS